jgi:alanine racemase
MSVSGGHLSQAWINLDHLAHNLKLLGRLADGRPLWPAIKANAYGHGAVLVAEAIVREGHDTLCVAHVGEAAELRDAGIEARLLVLSATLPEHAEELVALGCEIVVCTTELADALASAARRAGRSVAVHVKVDTGMGRIGVAPESAAGLLAHCRALPGLEVRGLMSHFARADEADKAFSLEQLSRFAEVAKREKVPVVHMANSAAIFDLPDARFDAVRPGIAIYGLRPSQNILNPRVEELRPVLEWKSRVTYLKEVPAGTGLSYGHSFHTERPSLIATVPVGYGDGFSRLLTNDCEMLVQGLRCPQVGTVTMDQSLVDVTALKDKVRLGDEVVIIGRQGADEITADELAVRLGTINYEVVTAISSRVPRCRTS